MRKTLIKKGKSHIDNKQAIEFINKYLFWAANSTNQKMLALKHKDDLLYVAPPTFKKQLVAMFDQFEQETGFAGKQGFLPFSGSLPQKVGATINQ